ncbi:MAG: HlyD family secretion protein [Bacteroides sp.]|nr:HlyD family secretion protein [Bacteroides sp.]
MRWGTSAFFGILLLLFAGGCFFNYPDVVEGEITVTTEYPPVWLMAASTGRLTELRKAEGSRVEAGEIVAVLENTAATQDVLAVKERLSAWDAMDSLSVQQVVFPEYGRLGEVQVTYTSFLKSLNTLRDFFRYDLYAQKEKAVMQESREYTSYIRSLHTQVELNREEMNLAETAFLREERLFEQGVTSKADYEEARQAYLSWKQTAEQHISALSTARIQEACLRQEAVEIRMERARELNRLYTELQTLTDELHRAIGEWELRYLLISPVEGLLSYNEVWQTSQHVGTGDPVFPVVTADPGEIVGKVRIPLEGAGKVRVGQRVNIRLTGYPYLEYGFLTGSVSSVSLVPREDTYAVTVCLPQELRTSYQKELEFTGELAGIAEIMTDEQSFTARLLSPLRYVWEKYF